MAFDSFGAFLAMEGHGPYDMGASYGVFFCIDWRADGGFMAAAMRGCKVAPARGSPFVRGRHKPDSDTAPKRLAARLHPV